MRGIIFVLLFSVASCEVKNKFLVPNYEGVKDAIEHPKYKKAFVEIFGEEVESGRLEKIERGFYLIEIKICETSGNLA